MLGIPFLDAAVGRLFRPQTYDDPVDRLNYFITPSLLAFFALMVSAKQYVGSPIQCWTPQEFKGGWEQYAEDYCFIQNTYYVPHNEEIPAEIGERHKREFGYYQWVPIMLALQAAMFYIPNWIWKTLHRHSGLDLSTAITDAQSLRSIPSCERKKELNKLATYVGEALELLEERRTARQFFCFRFGRSLGSYMSMLYLFTKLMNLLNVFGQFYLLNSFIGTGFTTAWGWHALQALWSGGGWEDTPIFPRVSICDFTIRKLANLHRYTLQCVLMINMFNEKIYLFLWFWFLFVGVSTTVNFLYCLVTLISPSGRFTAIGRLLKLTRQASELDEDEFARCVEAFTSRALRPDGVLLLRFVEGHAGAIVARDLCACLFKDYLEYLKEHHDQLIERKRLGTSGEDSAEEHASLVKSSHGHQRPGYRQYDHAPYKRHQVYQQLPPPPPMLQAPPAPGSLSTKSTSPGGGQSQNGGGPMNGNGNLIVPGIEELEDDGEDENAQLPDNHHQRHGKLNATNNNLYTTEPTLPLSAEQQHRRRQNLINGPVVDSSPRKRAPTAQEV